MPFLLMYWKQLAIVGAGGGLYLKKDTQDVISH